MSAEKDVHENCGCFACIGDKPAYEGAWLTVGMSRMIVCATCGNKRCPHGTDHRNACTGSNEPGQVGSRYGTAMTRPTPPAACSHGEPEGACPTCAACSACRGECGVCPYVTSPVEKAAAAAGVKTCPSEGCRGHNRPLWQTHERCPYCRGPVVTRVTSPAVGDDA